MSAGTGRQKAVTGFVVKKETREEDPTTKVVKKTRIEVSRVYHSRDAAVMCMELFKKQNPDGDYFVSEKTKRDDAQIY